MIGRSLSSTPRRFMNTSSKIQLYDNDGHTFFALKSYILIKYLIFHTRLHKKCIYYAIHFFFLYYSDYPKLSSSTYSANNYNNIYFNIYVTYYIYEKILITFIFIISDCQQQATAAACACVIYVILCCVIYIYISAKGHLCRSTIKNTFL